MRIQPVVGWLTGGCDNDVEGRPAGRMEEKNSSLSVADGAVRNLHGKRRGEVLPTKQGKRGPLVTEIDSS
jgi:hypothetical protein